MPQIMPRKLAIDIADGSGLRGTWKIVCGNDLIAERRECNRLCVAETLPFAARGAATTKHRNSTGKRPTHRKLPARQPDLRPSPAHRKSSSAEPQTSVCVWSHNELPRLRYERPPRTGMAFIRSGTPAKSESSGTPASCLLFLARSKADRRRECGCRCWRCPSSHSDWWCGHR
jgi:hypothetical protein